MLLSVVVVGCCCCRMLLLLSNVDIIKNPFNFQPFGLNFLELTVDGKSMPTVPFQPKYQDNESLTELYHPNGYVHEFLSLFK